uniref:maltase-glucoamylase, intestinal n=1 Tax=Oncorhynchus gorbuscha TaxID=8017 RepID=UPI001EAEFD5D|nr:maltase-glucoamylase, intestinal [Oncorhynchus gorbuscha]XP_046169637.1 maltase-glucoamylase, intestinal [Oncorhynchus gorbuscha]XP_046169639.1 maltase-glucoamylase, intestinal [Oncorhynchus gorbuscha]XP_046169640.1 maltase-glucoamylase, intestinal [Oncorhynchus gorbuscha]
MGNRKFSGLEVTLTVLFLLVTTVAVALVALMATGEPAVIKDETTGTVVPECPVIPLGERVDCFPDAGASKLGCLQRGCCWSPLDERNAPWCFFSTNHGYSVVREERPNIYSLSALLKRKVAPSLFGEDIEELAFHADLQTVNRLRFKISDAHKQRFEVPHEHIKPPATHPSGSFNYEVELTHNPFGFQVRRAATKKVLFDTTMGPLVFADQYLQLSARLPSHNIYGLGEHVHQNYRHDTNWRTWPIFSRDSFPNGGTHNLYGHYPYFLCLEDESGKSFGVFLMNSNAMEVTLQPAPAVTYRTIGGVLDFYILLGDTPEQVVHEFLELIGKPMIPPYWSLGFQLSRWDYGSLEEVKRTVERNRAVDLPYDIQYTDIDYMEDKKDFTYDEVNFKGLPQFADYLHEKGQKYILILDPAIATSKRINGPYEAYDRGTQKNAWVTEADGKTPLVGEVWPGVAVFPDYTNPSCKEWWIDEYVRLFKEIKHDALWIDMNEVSNFMKGSIKGCDDNNLNYPPFTPSILDGVLYSKTLCMDSKQTWGNHYDVHSLYGYAMVLATRDALERVFEGNRSLILTRSSFPGVGKYSGHWLGDNAANWNDIKWAIPGMLEFGLFGIPYIGADICGFFDDVSEELCRRWMQVGAFYPFSRNHNAQHYKPQDPAAFGVDSLLVNTSKHYLNIRYTLLPYLYTLFYKAHTTGDTVVRPVMHEFYSDNNTWTVDRQFLWGKHLLITPVLDPGVEWIQAYVPDAVWFDYEKEERITVRKNHVDIYLPADKLGLHIRGGAILPIQRPAVTTVYSRRNPMGLIVALDDNNRAAGELFWDDGDSRDTVETGNYMHYQFSLNNGELTIQVMHSGYSDPNNLKFENITVLGVSSPPMTVNVTHNNNNVVVSTFKYDTVKQVLYLKDLNLILGQNYTVRWDQVSDPVPEIQRFDCYPEPDSDETKCRARGCIWGTSTTEGVPWCYYPEDYGYTATTVIEQPSGWSFDITRNAGLRSSGRPESPDINSLRVEIKYHSADLLQFKIYDPTNKRFEVPVPLNVPSTPETDETKRLYIVQVKKQPFGIQVIRKSTGTLIWDSALPGFTFSDLFIQVSTRLSSDYVYGFGETEHASYKHDLNYHTWGMFTKDQPPGYKLNGYGVHPFYMGLETTADAHGVLLLNSNAMDVTFQPTPALTYRTLGGILDFYIVMGPTPELVVEEYTALIGHPVLPAYWSLGFQLCRYGYANDTEIADLYREMRAAGIPYDVQYADIDYMERQLNFVLDSQFQGLPALVDHMRGEGMRFIFILDPAIGANETTPYTAFDRGVEEDVFIKWPKELSNDIVWGKVWPDFPGVVVNESVDWDTQVEIYRSYAAFPDFFMNRTATWWQREISDFYNKIMKFDGLWIDMNEPSSFVHGTVGEKCLGPSVYDNPPYMPPLESSHRGLNHKTLCMNSQQHLSDGTPVKHYDVHNLYGWSHTKPTYDALLSVTGKRGIVVTRSTYPSSGKWAGHWLGDNNSSWDQLYKSIIGMMEFSLFGFSYTGADICGFFNPAEFEMCLRWTQLGAFYPYSRNHNGKFNPRQDPVSWNASFSEASRDVLNIRYTLLPYLYTLMFYAHSEGSTVVRPLLHEFVSDRKTWDIHRQFLWGPALLISPVLDEGAREVQGYIPDDLWYDFHTAKAIEVKGQMITMPTPLDHINLHVRGGYILPCQKPENNTHYSRKNPLGLIVALSDNGTAQGSLFWDDGEGIDTYASKEYLHNSFTVASNTLTCHVMVNGLPEAERLTLGVVNVWGVGSVPVTEVTLRDLSGSVKQVTFQHNTSTKVLIADATDLSVRVDQGFMLTWKTNT